VRLLLLEDDQILGEALRDFLRSEGHVVEWCTRLAQARVLIGEPFDVWLLDWNLPDGSGVQWLQLLRQKGLTVPAIVLTARDLLKDRIEGLDGGADDFLVKPFAPEELSARLRALSRRGTGQPQRKRFGSVQVDLTAHDVFKNGRRVEVTAREWAVLEALVLRAGRVVSASDLEALVLGLDGDVSSNVLQVHVFRLRSKLGKDLIETVRGLGYRIPAGEPS